MASDTVSELAKALEDLSVAENGGRKHAGETDDAALLAPIHLFRIGLVLSRLQENGSATEYQQTLSVVQDLLNSLPLQYLSNVLLRELNAAFSNVVMSKDDSSLLSATQSVCGIYSGNKVACAHGFSTELCSSLATAYDYFRQVADSEVLCTSLLRTLSSLLIDGLMQDSAADEEERIETIMEFVQSLTLDQQNTYLGDTLDYQQRIDPARTYFPSVLKSRFEASTQRDYLILMLGSAAQSSSSKATASMPTAQQSQSASVPKASKRTSPHSEIHRRIQLVLDVMPDLGEGYIESALSCFQGDVERTVATLLEGEHNPSSLPVALQRLDRSLPARHTETTPDSYTTAANDDEALRVTKQRVADMQRQQEAEAYALTVMTTTQHDEYADDYDDQYDGMDGGDLGGGDGETYDIDLDTIRTYNQVARAAEKEESFWEDNHNLNRKQAATKKEEASNGDEGQSKYRGPDKGKGGRAIGPDGKYLPTQKGGKKGRQQQARQQAEEGKTAGNKAEASGGMSKVQKRRKNDNKAKVANHHRKERAQKKASFGM